MYHNKYSREVNERKQVCIGYPKKRREPDIWGISSAGRAPALHAGGQEFESPILHHFKIRAERLFFNAFQAFLSSDFSPHFMPAF